MKKNVTRLPLFFFLLGALVLCLLQSCGSSSDPDPDWKFAYMSDNKDAVHPAGVNLAAVGRIAADMRSQGVSLVLVGGDLIDGRGLNTSGLNDQYAAWFGAMAPVYDAGIQVYAVPGNHEYWGDTAASCDAAWAQSVTPNLPLPRADNPVFAGREYAFTHRNALFIGLDQNQFERGAAPFYYRGNDVLWVREQLQARNADTHPHAFVFGHMPMFMTSFAWTDAGFKANREEAWDALGAFGVQIYFTGHSHLYARGTATTADGRYAFRQMIAGSAGAGFEPWNGAFNESTRIAMEAWNNTMEGYALVTVQAKNVQVEWRSYDPGSGLFKTGDSFSYTVP